MATEKSLKVTVVGDREIAITRAFDAPRALVWEAYTTPALLRRWLGVFGGWTFEVCDIDLRVGGAYRYVWRGPSGEKMGMGGVYREIAPPERLVATERFDESWYPGGAESTLALTEAGGLTTLTLTVRYDSREARDAVLKSPMEHGLAAGFDNLEGLLTSMEPRSGIDTPRIVKTEAVATACIHLTIPRHEIAKVMGPGLQEIRAALKSQGIAPAGPWLTYHRSMSPDVFDFEISVPVTRAVRPVGRVKPGELPAATVARTVYRGPYEGLFDAWPELDAWISAHGRKAAASLWEVYLSGPESTPDPAAWQTELNRPLAG